jgi:hypothetical protein
VARAETLLADHEKARNRPPHRGVPSWLAVTALAVGIVAGVMVIARLLG